MPFPTKLKKNKVKAVILAVRARVLEGYSLAKSFAEFPKCFTSLYCATIAAGEQTGHLNTVLERLADYTEKQQHIKRKVMQALIYPIIMIVVSLFIVTFLLIYVVPKMIAVFRNTGQKLPMLTTWLIAISHFLQHYGIYLLIVIVILIVAFRYALRNQTFRQNYHHLLLRIPVTSAFIRSTNTARFIRTFGVLLAAGVSVIEAMTISAKLVTSIPIRQSIELATQRVHEGANIFLSLKQCHYFPAMSLHLIASGEASGKLEAMLERAANNQDNDVEQTIDTTLTLFEPLMILVMGGVVLFIVLAVLLPIFSLDQFGG